MKHSLQLKLSQHLTLTPQLAPPAATPAAWNPGATFTEASGVLASVTRATVDLLKVLLKMKCEAAGVAQKLVATTADLELVAADDDAATPPAQPASALPAVPAFARDEEPAPAKDATPDEHLRFLVYLARGLEHRGSKLDEGEFLDVVPMTLDEVREALLDGRIVVVDPSADGVTIEPVRNLAGEPRETMRFDGTPVLLSAEAPAGVDSAALRRRGALCRSAQISGACDRIAEMTVEYAGQRSQFGQKINRFQAVAAHHGHRDARAAQLREPRQGHAASRSDGGSALGTGRGARNSAASRTTVRNAATSAGSCRAEARATAVPDTDG